MDQEAEAMKTKKILWPWAERQIKGKKKTSGPKLPDGILPDQKILTPVLGMIQNLPMIPAPLRSMNGSTPSCA